jgi:hypothetical protein
MTGYYSDIAESSSEQESSRSGAATANLPSSDRKDWWYRDLRLLHSIPSSHHDSTWDAVRRRYQGEGGELHGPSQLWQLEERSKGVVVCH